MNVLGSFWNPYSYPIYQTMSQGQTWQGGWVFINGNQDKIYITTNGSVEQDNGNELGGEENPFSLTAFNEMFRDHTWIGGYVQEEDDCVYYPPQEDESGCGCGCGEGCGCGNRYLREGQGSFRPMGWGVGLGIVVAWGSGYFSALNKPSVSAAFYVSTNDVGLPLNASWEGDYRVRITGAINLVDESGTVLETFNISEYYNIPGSYYN